MISFGGVDLDPVELGINGNAILGIKESGKSYLGTELGEIFFDNDIPFVAFDPIGIWHNMRTPGRGKGYPVVVAGGFHGDIPLTAATAPAIVEAAMKKRVSVVLDLFHPELSKADWRKIVKDCAFLLLHKNAQHGLRHVFIEEAAEFVPQKVLDGQVYDAVERLIRMGGNSRLGCTLITPRSQEVNKAVLELCENLFLFRQRGKNALENLKKWLEIAGNDAKNIIQTLPNLEKGQCWAWLGGRETPVLIQVPEKSSFHPDRRQMGADAAGDRKKPVSATKFVQTLLGELPKVEEEAKASDPKALKAEIKRLEGEVAKVAAGKVDPAAIRERDVEIARLKAIEGQLVETTRRLKENVAAVFGKIRVLADMERLFDGPPEQPPSPAAMKTSVAQSPPIEPARLRSPAPESGVRGPVFGEVQQVPSGCQKALSTLASIYPGGMPERQWAMAAGYKIKGGTWGEYRRRLLRAEMIEQRGDQWFATAAGAASAGPVELPPERGPELARWWAKKISGTPRMVERLLQSFPQRLPRDLLADALEMAPGGGTFGEYVRRLKRNGIVDENREGIVLAPEVMGAP